MIVRSIAQGVARHHESSRRLRALACCAGALAFVALPLVAESQSANLGGRWTISGEAGGVLGGKWLDGPDAPTITSGAGAELSLRALYPASNRVSAGVAVRVAAQSLRLREQGASWDGGTLTTGQLLAIAAYGLSRGISWDSDLDVGGGLTLLSGARAIFPFSTASRVAPSGDVGVSFRHQASVSPSGARRRSLIGQTGLFARYGITRLDPGSASPGGAVGVSGWVTRTSVGLRIER